MFKDPVLNKLVKIYPPPEFVDRSEFLLHALIKAIVSQQLSVKAADTILTRFNNLFAPKEFPTPEDILRIKDAKIRESGISYAKASYIKSLASAFAKNEINVDKLIKMSDEEVIVDLTKLKGVGKWTAEMILIFALKRPDVFSVDDLGVRRAIEKLYGITDRVEMIKLSENWRPHRSTACWYLWRSLTDKT